MLWSIFAVTSAIYHDGYAVSLDRSDLVGVGSAKTMSDIVFYSNGNQWYGSVWPEHIRGRSDGYEDEYYDWWPKFISRSTPDWAAQRLFNTIFFERRRTGIANPPAQDIAQMEHESWQLLEVLNMDPCASFSSRPKGTGEPWNMLALACLAHWYFSLPAQYQEEFRKDVAGGYCYRWMPVVLSARKQCGVAASNPFAANIPDLQDPSGGDDSYNADWEQYRDGLIATHIGRFGDTASPWPVAMADGSPLTIPGLPQPCTPFPQCVVESLGGLAPCTPWPKCAYDAATQFASMFPGAQVLQDENGLVYRPEQPKQVAYPEPAEEPSKSSSYVLPVLLGITAVATLAFAAVMSAASKSE